MSSTKSNDEKFRSSSTKAAKIASVDSGISRLPACILERILSSLDLGSALRSGVVFRGWTDLHIRNYTFSLEIARIRHASYRLRIRTHHSVRWSVTDEVLTDALKDLFKRPEVIEELRLCLGNVGRIWPGDGLYKLPRGILPSGTLRILELVSCDISDVGTMNLANVEILTLNNVKASRDDLKATARALELLISSCVNVKKLELVYCRHVGALDLSLGELRELMLGCCSVQNITIDAPKLEFVKSLFQHTKLCLKNSPGLRRGLIGSEYCLFEISKIRNLLSALDTAEVIELRCCGIDRMITLDAFADFPPLYRVKKFLMNAPSNASLAIVAMLKLFPNLEYFSLDCYDYRLFCLLNKVIRESFSFKGVSACCLTNSLKTIELSNLNNSQDSIELAKFLVSNTRVLDEINSINCAEEIIHTMKPYVSLCS